MTKIAVQFLSPLGQPLKHGFARDGGMKVASTDTNSKEHLP